MFLIFGHQKLLYWPVFPLSPEYHCNSTQIRVLLSMIPPKKEGRYFYLSYCVNHWSNPLTLSEFSRKEPDSSSQSRSQSKIFKCWCFGKSNYWAEKTTTKIGTRSIGKTLTVLLLSKGLHINTAEAFAFPITVRPAYYMWRDISESGK